MGLQNNIMEISKLVRLQHSPSFKLVWNDICAANGKQNVQKSLEMK